MSIPIKIKRKADGSIDNITFCPTVTIEKQVWESTLHRSMVLQAENEELKEILERHKKATAKAQIRSFDLEIINAQLKDKIERLEKQYDRAKWWLNEIVNNHRFTPISTAEKALKDLSELEK